MKDILAQAQQAVLEQLSWSNVLLGFDFDGTLAPIVRDSARAALRPGTRRRLTELARLYPTVVISGRTAADVGRRLTGIELRAVVGNHGLEPWRATDEIRRRVRAWKARLAPRLELLAGVELEDKTYSLTIHFRRSRTKRAARAGIASALQDLKDVRVIGGKQVVNLVPPGAPHKGIALERERERLGCDTAFFLGDDATDEDVFALDRPGRLLTVRVGAARSSLASYCLRSQSDVDELLARLCALRRHAARRMAR